MADSAVKLKLLELRLKRAFNISKGSAAQKQTLVARYKRGIGEGSSSIHYGASSEQCLELTQQRLQKFHEDWNVAALKKFIGNLPPSLNVARCAIEMAMLDHLAKELELPLHTYLQLPAPKKAVSAFTITHASDDDVMRQLESASAFRNLKLKVGFAGDLKFIDLVLKQGEKRLYLDSNGGWTRDDAIEHIRALRGYPVEFYEQPLAEPTVRELDRIKTKVECKLFLDESVIAEKDIERFYKVVNGVNLKLSKNGGIKRVIALAEIAREHKLQLLLGCMLESAIGITAALHLSSLFDYFDLDAIMLTENDPYWGAHFDADVLVLPGGPGIGITSEEVVLA
ncbi:MAG: enolase C-terminal domain-like protein [Candidatus Zixiibacteriota bacterium]